MWEVTVVRSDTEVKVMKKMRSCLERKFKNEQTDAAWLELCQYKMIIKRLCIRPERIL